MMSPKRVLLFLAAGVLAYVASSSFSPRDAAGEPTDDQDDPPTPSPLAEPKVPNPGKTIDEIFTEMAEKVPGFGGAIFSPDPSERAILVFLTDTSQDKLDEVVSVAAQDYANDLASFEGIEVRAVQANYDFKELRSWYDSIRAKLGGDFEGLLYTDIQEADNRLEFGVETEDARENLLGILDEYGVPQDAASVVITDPGRDEGLQDYNRPIIGGLRIRTAETGQACTMGFHAVWSGMNGFFTTHHCTSIRGWVGANPDNFYQTDLNQPTHHVGEEHYDPGFETSFPGCNSTTRPCRFSDSTFIADDPGLPTYHGRLAAANEGDPGWPGSAYYYRITGTRNAMINETVFKVGQTTGVTHGQVYTTCANWDQNSGSGLDYPVRYLCQSASYYGHADGDSGSAVFACPDAQYPTWDCPNTADVTLLGIHKGDPPFGDGGAFGSFERMVTYEYGSLDVTYPGGGK